MTHYFSKIFIVLLASHLFACGQTDLSTTNPNNSLSVDVPQRIITLAPHLTELLFSLGVEKRIIATVEYSDYPEAAKNIPRIGDAFRIDWEQMALLKPDLILAWEGGNPQSLIAELERRDYRVEKYPNASLFKLPRQLQKLGDLVNASAVGVGKEYTHGLQVLVAEYKNKQNIDVFYQISAQPIYSVGNSHTISEMLQVCGARNVFSDQAELASPLSPEAIVGANPDVVLTSNGAYAEVSKAWGKLQSIRQDDILKVPSDEVSRASLRMLQGVKNICEELDVWRQKRLTNSEP